jgi:hypothetical protein
MGGNIANASYPDRLLAEVQTYVARRWKVGLSQAPVSRLLDWPGATVLVSAAASAEPSQLGLVAEVLARFP